MPNIPQKSIILISGCFASTRQAILNEISNEEMIFNYQLFIELIFGIAFPLESAAVQLEI